MTRLAFYLASRAATLALYLLATWHSAACDCAAPPAACERCPDVEDADARVRAEALAWLLAARRGSGVRA